MASDPTAKGDELARTATEAASATARGGAVEPIEGAVGRYRLERELGAGAMGVVHAAFDPDLERRIALKVLRVAAPGTEAKDRLLREARAMARLAHPNVVTVHEVGTTNGRDFIAMELIQGETLADWLRSARRRPAEIVQAFVAAGRGLAAAHAAGIVHRDFKPHNVLRNRDGRIVVTDFGLAREAKAELPVALDVTLPIGAGTATGSPSLLSGITITGSLLGTPAYMAPEQWSGGTVTPATDQFAFCVALWEALAGERPYRGPTLEDLRKQAALGPGALDASKIPRRLRPILRRGLHPDPARRWPNMDALLARIVRVERRAGLALVIAAGGVVAAVALVLAMRAGHHLAAPGCGPPALDPANVWSAAAHAEVGNQTAAAKLLDADMAAWTAARATACKDEPRARAPRLQCLDGVLARIDAVARAARGARDGGQIDAGALLIDPQVCALAPTPRLITTTSPEFRDAVAVRLERTGTPVPLGGDAAAALVMRTAADPCASALAHLVAADIQKAAAERSRDLDEAQQDAARCADDRIVTEVALAQAQFEVGNEFLNATVTGKLRSAEVAVQRVAQRDLTAEIDLLRVRLARRAENLDEAIARSHAAMLGFGARGRLRAEINAGIAELQLGQMRGAELAAIETQLAAWRRRAVAELGEVDEIVRGLDVYAANCTFARGDVAAAHAQLERLWRPLPNDPHRRVAGLVVDVHGKPVAGATVSAGRNLQGDAIGAAALYGSSRDSLRRATTGADGRFDIPDAVDDGQVIAELGERRSQAVPAGEDVRLEIAPTSRIEGRVNLAGESPGNVVIAVWDLASRSQARYAVIAPVAADGSFTVDGVPRREVRVFAGIEALHPKVMGGVNIKVSGPVVRGVALSVARSTRVVHVLVRSTVDARLANAEIVVLPGKVASMTALAMNQQFRGGSIQMARQIEGEHAPRQVINAARPGDLFATMTEVPDGAASACAIGLPANLSDEALGKKVVAHLDKLQVICVPIPSDADLVTIEVPPMPRLD